MKLQLIRTLLFLFTYLFTTAVFAGKGNDALSLQKSDTIIIEFGNNSRIMFIIDDKADLETLKQYDLNAMLKDLSLKLEENSEDASVLSIEDASGTRYLKDTTIVIQSRDSQVTQNDEDEDRSNDSRRDRFDRFDRLSRDFDDDRRRRRFWPRTRQSFNVELGTNNYLEDGKFPDENNRQYAVRPYGSWYVGLNTTYKTNVAGPLFIEWGAGVDWYNFKFQEDDTRVVDTDSLVAFIQEPNQQLDPVKSKLTAAYITAKFVPMLDFSYDSRKSRLWNYHGSGFRIGVGGYAGLRISSHSKFVFKEDGDRKKDRERDNFFMNNLRYGLRVQMGFRGIDMFVNYDVSELFSEGKGPELNAFTLGFTL